MIRAFLAPNVGPFILFLISVLPFQLEASVISAQAGRVQNEMVTTRAVLINAAIEKALGTQAVSRDINLSQLNMNRRASRELIQQTSATLIEWAVLFEAQAFGAAAVSEADVKKARRQLETKVQQNREIQAVLKKAQPTEEEILTILRRKLRAQKFIQFKIESSALPISDKEAFDYFEANRLQFEDLPFEKFKPQIKELLARQQTDRRIKDWFELLQAKYKIRNELAQ